MDVLRTSASPSASAATETGASGREEQRLRAIAKQFEAIFLASLLRSMRSTVPESDLLGDTGQVKYYRQLYDQELANQAAGSAGGLGIADLIVNQFTPQVQQSDPSRALERGGSAEPGTWRPLSSGVRQPRLPAEQGIARYRRQRTGDEIAAMVRLRAQADRAGGTVADSLSRYQKEINLAAKATGLDPALVLSVLMTESGGEANARSAKGALGLMQLMPQTARQLGLRQPLHPGENIMGGARYLADMLSRFDQRLELALAAYNAGPGAVQKAGDRIPPYSETKDYVRRVVALYRRLQGVGGADTVAPPARDGS